MTARMVFFLCLLLFMFGCLDCHL
uniref:Uncharacterized protein n=1 Tax=Arundo donax TaxID=35708 RepID=A0A0A9BMB4_ARUDO